MIKTLNELRSAKDKEVLKCIDEIKTDGTQTSDFQDKYGTDYSYTTLTSELKARGYSQRWVKDTKATGKEITVPMSPNNSRLNLNMTAECKERFTKFLSDKSYNFVHTTAALMSYMDDVEQGRIKVNIKAV